MQQGGTRQRRLLVSRNQLKLLFVGRSSLAPRDAASDGTGSTCCFCSMFRRHCFFCLLVRWPHLGHCNKRQRPGKILGHDLPIGQTTSSAASRSRAIPKAIGSNRRTTLLSTPRRAAGPSPVARLDAAFATCHTLCTSSHPFAPPALSLAGFRVILASQVRANCDPVRSRVILGRLLGTLVAGLIARPPCRNSMAVMNKLGETRINFIALRF